VSGSPPSAGRGPASEAERSAELRRLVARGRGGVDGLLAMRTDPSWSVRREVIAALAELGEASLAALSSSLLRERDDETRVAATVDALVASAGDTETALIAVSAGAEPAVLADVAQILGRRRQVTSIPRLAELAQHPDDNVAVGAIEALGRVGGRAVVDVLVAAVESRRFFRTFAAIDVLGKSGDPRAILPLAALLDNVNYSLEAARALGRSCDRAAAPPLARLLTSPGDAPVRVAALALAELRQRYEERFGTSAPVDDALKRSTPAGAVRRLIHCINGADDAERSAILILLGCLESEAAVPVLLRALDASAPVAKVAAEVLARVSRDADAHVLAALQSGTSARRQVLLPTIQQASAVDAVVSCLGDPDAGVRRLACDTLARIGNPQPVSALFEALRDPNPMVVQAATSAIQSLGSNATPTLAMAAALSPAPAVRRAALRILSYLGRVEALPVLAAATRDPEARVRDTAIIGLSLLETPAAVELLLGLAQDARPQTRASAARGLGEAAREPRVLLALRQALGDPEPWVRYYACQALGKLKDESCVSSIAQLADDPAGQVRVASIEALSHLPGDISFAALSRAARDPEIDLRRAALIGLGLSKRPEALSLLLTAAAAEDAATRLIVLSALAGFAAAETLETMARAAQDTDENVRMAALEVLGSHPAREATAILARFLGDPLLHKRARAALLAPHAERAQGLLEALRGATDETAPQLASLLARLATPDALRTLFEALHLPNVAARKAAATALAALGSRDAFSALQRQALEDADAEVRRVCALLISQ